VKHLRLLIIALLLAACASPPQTVAPVTAAPVRAPAQPPPKAFAPAGPFALRNPSFEIEAGAGDRCARQWHCTMHADPNSFRFFLDEAQAADGKRSFCVEPVKKEPWALVTQGIVDRSLNGARVRFTLSVRVDNVAGEGAGTWAQVARPPGRKPTFRELAKGSRGWQDQSVEFDVPEDAITVEVGATLRGTGRACFDNARLEVLRPGKNPV
jgi:hypothetical protein